MTAIEKLIFAGWAIAALAFIWSLYRARQESRRIDAVLEQALKQQDEKEKP